MWKRRLFRVSAVLSLLLLLAVAAAWGWTRGHTVAVATQVRGRWVYLGFRAGSIDLTEIDGIKPSDPTGWRSWTLAEDAAVSMGWWSTKPIKFREGIGWTILTGYSEPVDRKVDSDSGVMRPMYDVVVRWWLPFTLPLILPAIGMFLWARRTYIRAVRTARQKQGECPACGYDLRASGQRCPECGAERAVIQQDR